MAHQLRALTALLSICIQFSAPPTMGSSWPPETPTPENLVPSSGLYVYHMHAHAHAPPPQHTEFFLKKKNFKMEHHWTEHSDFDVSLSVRDTELNGDLSLGDMPYKLLYLCTYINYFSSYFLGFTAIYESL